MCTQANNAQDSHAGVLVFGLMIYALALNFQFITINDCHGFDHCLMGRAIIWVRESKTDPAQDEWKVQFARFMQKGTRLYG
jgi:drug/metabolite transporter superfamily protein YnfA